MTNLLKKHNLDRCKTVACRRCDRQTNKQTNRQTNGTDQYTLRKRPSGFRKVTNGTDQYTLRKVVDFRKVTNTQTNTQTNKHTNKQTDMGITIPRPPPMGGEVMKALYPGDPVPKW